MARSLHPLVHSLLEQRYQQNLVNENIASDAWEGVKSGWGKFRGAWEKKREELGQQLQDVATETGFADFAAEYIPGVAGMAVVEVPLAKQDPKAYDKARSELAMELVKARKQAFDNKEAAVSETDILSRAVANKPELAKILTKDEYESLSGGSISNPLQINVKKVDEKGKESETPAVVMQKWSGMDPGAEILYRTLRGAEESLLTPEGIATGAAFGAAFKTAGAAAAAAGKAIAPKLAPKAVAAAAEILPGAARARGAEELGAAVGQRAVDIAGLGLLGYSGVKAGSEGKLPEFVGGVAGGVLPFSVGAKGAELAGKGVKAATAPELNVMGEPLKPVQQQPTKFPEPEWVGKKYPEFVAPEGKAQTSAKPSEVSVSPKPAEPSAKPETPKETIGYGEFKPETWNFPGQKPQTLYKLEPSIWKFGEQPTGPKMGEYFEVQPTSRQAQSIYGLETPEVSSFDATFFPYGKPAGFGKVTVEPTGMARPQTSGMPQTTKATTAEKAKAVAAGVAGLLGLEGPEFVTRQAPVKPETVAVSRAPKATEAAPEVVVREPVTKETKTAEPSKVEVTRKETTKQAVGGVVKTVSAEPSSVSSEDKVSAPEKEKQKEIKVSKEDDFRKDEIKKVEQEKETKDERIDWIKYDYTFPGDTIPVKEPTKVVEYTPGTPPSEPLPPGKKPVEKQERKAPPRRIPPFIPSGGGGGQQGSRVGFEKLRGAMVNNDINAMLKNLYSVSQTLTLA